MNDIVIIIEEIIMFLPFSILLLSLYHYFNIAYIFSILKIYII